MNHKIMRLAGLPIYWRNDDEALAGRSGLLEARLGLEAFERRGLGRGLGHEADMAIGLRYGTQAQSSLRSAR
jgi:hypothetical protein